MKFKPLFYLLLLISSHSIYAQICGSQTFNFQYEIDDFPLTGCTIIDGNLIIDGQSTNNPTNLDGLAAITEITGNLIIRNCPVLATFALPNLTTLGGTFRIENNPQLIQGTTSLNSIGSTFIADNNNLENLDFFNNVNTVSSLHLL